ncbi:MAG: nuclease-related domain-containing protein [Pseudomonadota bacterium]
MSALPLATVPAVSAESATGITSVGPAAFLFSVALAMLLTLLFRRATLRLAGSLLRRFGQLKLRRAIAQISSTHSEGSLMHGAYGGLVRLDHVMLTAAGYVCVRAVHGSGTVFGAADDAQWTLVDGDVRKRFLNPLIQNEGRCRALRQAVGDIPVTSLVVFTGRTHFASERPDGVVNLDGIRGFHDKLVFGPSKVTDWDAAWMTFREAVLTDEDSARDHAAQISFG